ncbi:MAG: NADP-dependent alcohol dehydrogenase [Leptolyngbya sp. SIO4C1]|nr:NADP-dependent alcohol dehydrogenase [Leptolyngbya sp. SIO4C1]
MWPSKSCIAAYVIAGALMFGQKSVAGSMVGGIPDTQEVLDFCAKHDIHPNCEMIRIDEINEAFKRLERGEIAHRFVIDMASLKDAA